MREPRTALVPRLSWAIVLLPLRGAGLLMRSGERVGFQNCVKGIVRFFGRVLCVWAHVAASGCMTLPWDFLWAGKRLRGGASVV